jgi:hypothetical protein
MRVRDYRLDAIYNVSGSQVFNTYLEPWLIDATTEFAPICDQDLSYIVSGSATEGYFSEILTTENKVMISKLMVKYFLAKSISDVLQFSNVVSDRDFKTFSAAQNLTAKTAYYNTKREELSQEMLEYSLRKNQWSQWNLQIFS